MRKLFNICVLSLLASIAAAQSTATHQLKVTWQPLGSIFMQAYYTDSNGKYQQYNSEALDAFDMQVSAGQIVSFSGHGKGFVLKQVTANGQATDFETSESSYDTYYGTYYFTYTMPDADVELVFTFEYDPDAPDFQPGDSGWYPETGTLVWDHRTHAYPANFNMEEDAAKVIRLILGGPWVSFCSSSDARLFPHCHLLDYSRTAATQCSPWEDWSETAVTEVILPSTMQELGERSFAGAHLQSLTCFAMTPPKMSGTTEYDDNRNIVYKQQNAFTDCPGMVVYVPEDALPLYQNANGWKEFTILPIEGNSVSLNVNLMAAPTDAALAPYKNMHLELTSLGTGQVRRLLVGPRNAYTFRYLPTNTSYRLVLRSASGAEMGRIDAVTLGETDGSVTFPQLNTPRNVTLNVTADGQQVSEEHYSATWLTAANAYIARGSQLPAMLEGQQLRVVVALDRELAMKYEQPDTVSYTVVGSPAANNTVEVSLAHLANTTITLQVIDSLTNRGISDAAVRVSQILAKNEQGNVCSLTTDAKGKATGEATKSMSVISVNTAAYGAQSFTANLADSTDFRVVFAPANGTAIQIDHTWQAAVNVNQEPAIENGYSNERSLQYEFTNLSTGEPLTRYLEKRPFFTLYATLPEDTRIGVKAISSDGKVEPVEAEGVVDANGMVKVTLPIVERGYIHASYLKSESNRPAVMVFNSTTGELVRKQAFGNYMSTDISGLPLGDYDVVAMSQGEQYQGISNKSHLKPYSDGSDYVMEHVTIANGVIADAPFPTIPLIKTPKNTLLKEYRAYFKQGSVCVGDFATVSVTASFIDDLPATPTDIQLVVNLPEGTRLVSGSVMKGKELMAYSYEGNLLSVAWDELKDAEGNMLFCIISDEPGDCCPEASIVYTLGSEERTDPLTTTALHVNAQSIKVPEIILTPTLHVKGTVPKNFFPDPPIEIMAGASHRSRAAGPDKRMAFRWHDPNFDYSPIIIMDGDEEIGRISPYNIWGNQYSHLNTEWEGTVTLPDPYIRSKHHIWAKLKGRSELRTEAKEVMYNPNAVIPLTTKMSFFNYHPVHLENVDVTFDYVKNTAEPASYGFSNEEGYNTDFTFEVNLSNNDTTKVYACALHIFTEGPDAEERIAMAHYNTRKGRWIAYEKFNTRSLPNCVVVEPFYYEDVVGSRAYYESCNEILSQLTKRPDNGAQELEKRLEELIRQGNEAYNNGQPLPIDEIICVVNQLDSIEGIDTSDLSIDDIDVDKLLEEAGKWGKADMSIYNSLNTLVDYNELVKGFNITTAEGETEASLKEKGYEALLLDDGSSAFVLTNDDVTWSFVDLKQNIKIEINVASLSRRAMASSTDSSPDSLPDASPLMKLVDDLKWWYDRIADNTTIILATVQKLLAENNNWIKACDVALKSKSTAWWKVVALSTSKFAVKSTITSLEIAEKALKWIKSSSRIGALGSAFSLISDFYTFNSNYQEMNKEAIHMLVGVRDCDAESDEFWALFQDCHAFSKHTIDMMIKALTIDLGALSLSMLSVLGAPETAGLTMAGVVAGLASSGMALYTAFVYAEDYEMKMPVWKNQSNILWLACKKRKDCMQRGDCPKCVDTGDCPHWPRSSTGTGPTTKPLQDPSGFVYEGVESNRVQGATTTVFYKTQEEDMYGDPVDVVMAWDAENYGQVNPQQTDENGEYGWMVPEGWWQVKYEKEGYQTEYSEWLPVPPPQLDVNQNLVQYSQPIVSGVKATQQGVQVQFDKYMRPATLTTENIHVTRQGNELPGTIELLNAEQHDGVELASKVRFVPSEPLPVGQTLVLTVGGDVQSYAKVAMGDAFTQEFDIVQAVEKIVADSAVNVIYDQTTELTISAMPAQAAAGHKVKVRLLSDVVASISADELTLDADGKAALRITGEAHGTTGIILQMANDEDVQTLVMVNVKDESDFVCPLPTANYISGTQLYYGTAVELSNELPGATIYYTLDGSCPCEQDMKYTQPIIVTADTYIKAIAVADGYMDSDIRELRYTVRRDATRLHLPVGWTWLSHAQRDEVALSQLGEGIDYVVGEAGNQVSMLLPATAYKAHTNTSHDALLQGFAWDAATGIIQLQTGWNWMPYPMPVSLTPAEALAYALPQDGEVLVGEDGFAIYESGWDGAAWTGTLQKMEPGHAYMYLSASERPIYLNTTVVKSQADNVQPPTMFRWYDRHAQPNRMPVVAQLYDAQGTLIDSDLARYEVMAWSSDDQCRGNGYWMERQGCLFLNVVGLDGEQVEFRVHDTLTDKTHALRVVDHSALTFTTDVQGTLAQPIRLEMGGELSGIIDVQRSVSCVTSIYDLQGRRVTTPQQPNSGMQRGVYIDRGKKIVVK